MRKMPGLTKPPAESNKEKPTMPRKAPKLDDETWGLLDLYAQWYFKQYGTLPKIRTTIKYAMKSLCGRKGLL